MSKTIQTTGDLRTFLTNVMVGVKDGVVNADDASRITKLAQQINESFYSEIKIAQIRIENLSFKPEEIAPLGSLAIGGQPK